LKNQRNFIKFLNRENIIENEDAYLKYFLWLKNHHKYASSTMWQIFGCLNFRSKIRNNVSLNGYNRLVLFLKSISHNHVYKKANVFTYEDMCSVFFLGIEFLVQKVVFFIGIEGLLRSTEIDGITWENVVCNENEIKITIKKSKTDPMPFSFIISEEMGLSTLKFYIKNVPKHLRKGKFLKTFRKGKFINSNFGIFFFIF